MLFHNAEYYITKGDEFYERKDFIAAIEEYTKATKKEPNNIMAFQRRGNAYERIEKYNEMIKDADISLTLQPMVNIFGKVYNLHISAYAMKAKALLKLKKYEEAETECLKALEIDPISTIIYRELARIYEVTGNYREAVKSLTKAISIEPDVEINFWLRGDIYKIAGKYEKAIKDYKTVMVLDPDDSKYMKDCIAECLELMAEDNMEEDDY